MNSKSLRRLAADHGSLHTAGLPPNYLFPPSSAADLPSDLTSLDILLAGPVGTPYANGVWRLHLDIPPTYPTAPPTATFRTQLWHPNIDEATGAVCVETLKRDWSSSLRLRDVLVTISCLLIQPNPASALNEAAGKLASEDWDSFCRRAKLMTEIHAAIPGNITEEVREAQSRGEEKEAQPEVKDADPLANGSAKATPSRAKVQVSAEDEENQRRRGTTVEPESDPESDWIPGPVKTPMAPAGGHNNVLGIQGLQADIQFDSPDKPRVIAQTRRRQAGIPGDNDSSDVSDPFINVPSKRNVPSSFNRRAPSTAAATLVKQDAIDTPELLKFSHKNPFSAIQTNNQTHPLLKEFSWSWADSEIMHETGSIKGGESKANVRKRMAGDDFVKKSSWEMKRFKKAGYDLKKYNRGEFGPKTGIARL